METARTRLRNTLTKKLVPAILASGFTGPVAIRGNALFHEYRRQNDDGLQVLSIQLDKYQRPRFVLNLRIEPPEGMEACMQNGGIVHMGRLKAKPGGSASSWFRTDRPWWQRLIFRRNDTLEHEAVEMCLQYLPETELWWHTQQATPHINTWPIRYRGQPSGQP